MKTALLQLGAVTTQFYEEHLTVPYDLIPVDFEDLNNYLPDQWLELEARLKPVIEVLATREYDRVIVPNITLHEALDRIEQHLPLVHPVELMKKVLRVEKVVLFGSYYTMRGGYLRLEIEKLGFGVFQPSDEDMVILDRLRIQVYSGHSLEVPKRVFQKLIDKYKETVVPLICCTELSVLSDDGPFVIDLARLQCDQ